MWAEVMWTTFMPFPFPWWGLRPRTQSWLALECSRWTEVLAGSRWACSIIIHKLTLFEATEIWDLLVTAVQQPLWLTRGKKSCTFYSTQEERWEPRGSWGLAGRCSSEHSIPHSSGLLACSSSFLEYWRENVESPKLESLVVKSFRFLLFSRKQTDGTKFFSVSLCFLSYEYIFLCTELNAADSIIYYPWTNLADLWLITLIIYIP